MELVTKSKTDDANWCFISKHVYKVFWDISKHTYRGADKSLDRPGRKQATATEDFDVHISYL
jgi:hypothetical protein